MRPLGIQPEQGAVRRLRHLLHHDKDFLAFSWQWQMGPWIGPAPHPSAVLSPARQLFYYVKHCACHDRESCFRISGMETRRASARVKDPDMKSLCACYDEAKKVQQLARDKVLFPCATAPKPPHPAVWLPNSFSRWLERSDTRAKISAMKKRPWKPVPVIRELRWSHPQVNCENCDGSLYCDDDVAE